MKLQINGILAYGGRSGLFLGLVWGVLGGGLEATDVAGLPEAKLLHSRVLFASPTMAKGGSALAKSETMKNGKALPVAKDRFGVAQYRIPQIIQTASGHLVVAVSARLSLPSDYGMSTTFFAHSANRGKSWTFERPATDYLNPKRVGNKKGAFPLTDGTQDTVIAHQGDKRGFTAVYINKAESTVYVTQSKNLKQWSQPRRLEVNQGFEYLCPGPASAQIDPDDGSIVMMVHGRGKKTPDGQALRANGAYLVRSEDGDRFQLSKRPMQGSESAVVPLGAGRYLAQSRGSQRRLALFEKGEFVSEWKFPEVSYAGCEASLARFGDSVYLLTPTGPKRNNGVLYRSRDEGKSWEALCLVHRGYFSYSSMTALDERHIAVVAERHFDPAKRDLMRIHFSVVQLPAE